MTSEEMSSSKHLERINRSNKKAKYAPVKGAHHRRHKKVASLVIYNYGQP